MVTESYMAIDRAQRWIIPINPPYHTPKIKYNCKKVQLKIYHKIAAEKVQKSRVCKFLDDGADSPNSLCKLTQL